MVQRATRPVNLNQQDGADVVVRVAQDALIPARCCYPICMARKELSLGEKVQLCRQRAGLAQYQVASQVGMSPARYSRLEGDLLSEVNKIVRELRAVANVLGVDVTDFLGGDSGGEDLDGVEASG